MSKILYTVRNPSTNSLGVGAIGFLNPGEQRSFSVEEDSPDDTALNALVSSGALSLVSANQVNTGTAGVPSLTTAQTVAVQGLVSGRFLAPARPKFCAFGDSTVYYCLGQLGQQISVQGASSTGLWGGSFLAMYADFETPSGVGTLSYDAVAKTLSWQAFGDTVGASVSALTAGMYKLPSGTANRALYVTWYGTQRSYTTGTVSITIAADGFQAWSYSGSGVALSAMAASGFRFDLATLPSGCPPGSDGFYGIGGGTAADLAEATAQTNSIISDVDYIQIGSNDFNGGSLTPAAFCASVQAFIQSRIDLGTSLVIFSTLIPRNTDTATYQRRKAKVTQLMRAYAATKGGKVVVWDQMTVVTEPTSGIWVSGYARADGIHHSSKGGTTAGYQLGDYLSMSFGANIPLFASTFQDTYDATENANGNLLPSGMGQMIGSAGTLGTGAVGSVATGWTAQRTSGSTMALTCSKVARTDGIPGEWLQVVLSGATANEIGRVIATAGITTALAVGGEYQMEMEVRIVACTSLNRLNNKIAVNGISARIPESFQGNGTDLNADISTPRTLWLKMPPAWKVSAGATSFLPMLEFGNATGGSATIQLGRTRFYRIS